MSRPKIYVNPKFHNNTQVHINPNFVPPSRAPEPVVHVNPLFLKLSNPPPPPQVPVSPAPTLPKSPTIQPLIRKTRHKLLRIKNTPVEQPKNEKENEITRPQMIKVGRNKLIKANIFAGMSRKAASIQSKVTSPKQAITGNKYKVDNRLQMPPKSSIKSRKSIQSRHKTLELKKINGTIYKTSTNKLVRQRTVSTGVSASSSKHTDRLISLNGCKSILKESGKRLIPIIKKSSESASTSKTTLEIAGIQFIQLMDGTYVRHHNHSSIVRQHLMTSKHKSIKILTKNLRKCNIPCPVFRRIGKCLAFTRGRCPKLHDIKFVDICPIALQKGLPCTKTGCLMSHDMSLHKMPACKYFLQGCCVNDPCLYLHNKLNESAPVCQEFLKGYCPEADQCTKRHEHERKSGRMKRKATIQAVSSDKKKKKLEIDEGSSGTTRYFLSDSGLKIEELDIKEGKSDKKDETPENEQGKEISDNILSETDKRLPMPSFIPI